VSVTPIGDKMTATTTQEATTMSAEQKEIVELKEYIDNLRMYVEPLLRELEDCQAHLENLQNYDWARGYNE
jgi:uncharacterized protein YlxW (UPF0749 family)